MIALNVFFWFMVILFGVIGSMRGWAKELLVFFSAVLGLFIITVLNRFGGFFTDILTGAETTGEFWLAIAILSALVFFGYQGPNLPKLAATNKFNREKLQDALLGFFLGAFNGGLIFGAFLYFLNKANYTVLTNIITKPPDGAEIYELLQAMKFDSLLNPESAFIYFAVAIAFAFVLVVFI